MSKERLIRVLQELRKSAGLTQAQLAQKLGESQSYVSKYENGEQRLDLMELEAIALATGTTLAQLVERYLGAD